MNFKKTANLENEDKSKLVDYWTDLWGKEYAEAVVKNYETTGDKKEVKAQKDGLKFNKVSKK